jgi:hypothetical protein
MDHFILIYKDLRTINSLFHIVVMITVEYFKLIIQELIIMVEIR